MSECMTFPDTVEEFIEQYKVVDTDHVYSNGVEFIPIFRMKQWFEHLPSAEPERKSGKWIEIKRSDINPLTGRCGVYVGCSECGAPIPTDSQLDYIDESEANYCINCGADMRGEKDV